MAYTSVGSGYPAAPVQEQTGDVSHDMEGGTAGALPTPPS